MYQCGVCKAEYARSDHLIRHVRAHTNQRPFSCRVCNKGFGRQDLLKRHMTTHSAQTPTRSSTNDRGEAAEHSGQHSQRVHRACRACASTKLKCTHEKPCKRCKDRNIPCELDPCLAPQGREGAEVATLDPRPTEQLRAVHNASFPPPLSYGIGTQSDHHGEDHGSPLRESITVGALVGYVPSLHDDFMQDIWGSTLNVPGIGDFVQPELNSGLGDLDFSFLDRANIPAQEMAGPISHSSLLGAGTEAFRKSDVLIGWHPETEGIDEQEDRNLILPRDSRPAGLSPFSEIAQISSKDLSLAMRDRVLAMLLRTASPKLTDSIIGSFPSIGVLKNLIHSACVHMNDYHVVQFIHLPSFDLNKQRSELLGALIAYGSVCSPSPQVRKFGYAVQEAVRTAIIHLVRFNSVACHASIGSLC